MRVTLSFNPNFLPRRLAASVKTLVAPSRLEWWRQARERGVFSLLHLQQRFRNGSLARQFSAQDLSRYAFCTSQSPLLPALSWQIPADHGQVEALLKGCLTVFGYPWQWSPDGSCWHRAPVTGDAWPRRFFADIPIRSGNP